MTDLELNKILCEFVGRNYHKPTEEEERTGSYYQYEPDFCNDRDTLAVALGFCTDSQLWKAIEILLGGKLYPALCQDRILELVKTNPRQWSEALVKAIGKWVEPAKCPTCGK
jgi:hypothetical protein